MGTFGACTISSHVQDVSLPEPRFRRKLGQGRRREGYICNRVFSLLTACNAPVRGIFIQEQITKVRARRFAMCSVTLFLAQKKAKVEADL